MDCFPRGITNPQGERGHVRTGLNRLRTSSPFAKEPERPSGLGARNFHWIIVKARVRGVLKSSVGGCQS